MFFYFPIKHRDGAVVGSVRGENGKATVSFTRPCEAEFYLFADGTVTPIRPGSSVPAATVKALIGVQNGKWVCFGRMPAVSASPEEFVAIISSKYTKQEQIPMQTVEATPQDAPVFPLSMPEEGNNAAGTGTNIHQDKIGIAALPTEPETTENPLTERAKSVFSHWERLEPEPEESEVHIPISGQNVDESVDVVDNPAENMVQIRDRLPFYDPTPIRDDGSEFREGTGFEEDEVSAPEAVPTYAPQPPNTRLPQGAWPTPPNGFRPAPPNPRPLPPNTRPPQGFPPVPPNGFRPTPPRPTPHDPLHTVRDDGYSERIRLFPRIFPGAKWRFVARDGEPPHYEGLWMHGGERIRIIAVRGTYAPQPPAGLGGFTRFLRSDGAGYWVRLIPLGRG